MMTTIRRTRGRRMPWEALNHPDAGGATATMQAINAAVAIIRKGS